MVRAPSNATIMLEGCEAMWRICMNANLQDDIGRRGGCAAVVVTLRSHPENATVTLAALQLATNLCYAQPKSPFGFRGWAHTHAQDELGRKQQSIPDIVQAMTRHAALAEVQDAAIRALSNLVYNHSENVLRSVNGRAIEAVVAAMQTHKDDYKVQEGGCLFIWSILARCVLRLVFNFV